MRTFLLLILCMSISLNHAQVIDENTTLKIDSILKIIKTQNGVEQLKSYEALGKLYSGKKLEIALLYIDSLKDKSEILKNAEYIIKSDILRAYYLMQKSDISKAEELYLRNIPLLDSLKLKTEVASAYSMLGITQQKLGNYDEALESHIKALKLAQDLNFNKSKMAGFYMSLAGVYNNIDKKDLSIKYLEKAEEAFKSANIKSGLMRAKANKAMLLLSKKDYLKAISTYKESAAYFEEVNDSFSMGKIYNLIAQAYKRAKDFNTAKIWYNKALNITLQTENLKTTAIIYRDLGRVAGLEKNDKEAFYYYNKSLEVNKKSGNIRGVLDDYSLITEYYLRNNDYKNAYETEKDYQRIEDSIYSKESNDKINELHLQFETEKKEAAIALQKEEINNLNIQAKNDKLTKTLYGIGMFSFLAIAGLLYFGFKQRIKKNKIEREKQEEIYKQEIKFKKKELATQTLHLVQKNTFIQELKENLEKIKQSPELFKVEFRRLVMLLKKESAEDKDWEVFKSYFSEVHNNFDNKLKDIYADISEKEIRLASFLRMNLSTKEIASMLNVLPESVLKSKYRLKKKLNLDKETDLTQFLNTL